MKRSWQMDSSEASHSSMPEISLICGFIARVICDLNNEFEPEHADSARAWLNDSIATTETPFSLRWCAMYLHVPSVKLKSAIIGAAKDVEARGGVFSYEK